MKTGYMAWAKTQSHARFNLATSGVLELPLSELPVRLEDIEITGPSYYGWPPLQERLAAKVGVPTSHLVAATGTSMANYLAMAAVARSGDEVLIEEPTYEPLLAVGRHLGAQIRRFARGDDGSLDPSSVASHLTPRTRLVVITNLHNPTSFHADVSEIGAVGEAAGRVGAHVLVDEVYLECLFQETLPSAHQLGPNFLVTGSLTKAYGLGGLRCGWVVAQPELVERMWELNDLYGNVPAHAAERLSLVALGHLGAVAERARRILEENRSELGSFLATRDDLEASVPAFGTVVFPKLLRGEVERLCSLLKTKYETSVVPGAFFDRPHHFRVGLGGRQETFREGLGRLGSALDELA